MAFLDRLRGPVAEWLRVFGQVPLFYYVAHLYVIHLAAIAGGALQGYSVGDMAKIYRQLPSTYGYGLPVIYLVWIAVVAGLYPFCRWFGIKKQGGRGWWWSYL